MLSLIFGFQLFSTSSGKLVLLCLNFKICISDSKNCLQKGENSDLQCNSNLNVFLRQNFVELGNIEER